MVDNISNNGSPGPVNSDPNIGDNSQRVDQNKVGGGASDDTNVHIDRNSETPNNQTPGQYVSDSGQLAEPDMSLNQARENGPCENGCFTTADIKSMGIFDFVYALMQESSKHDAEAKFIAGKASTKDMAMTLKYDEKTAEDQRDLSKTQQASDFWQAAATGVGGLTQGALGVRMPKNQGLISTPGSMGSAGGEAAKAMFEGTIGEENAQMTLDQSGGKSAGHASSVMDGATSDAGEEWRKDDEAQQSVANAEAQSIAAGTEARKLN